MDLKEYYLSKVKEDEYYVSFKDVIDNSETSKKAFFFDGVDQIFTEFKCVCTPDRERYDAYDEAIFYLSLFYFHKNGYYINQFPNLASNPPRTRYEFANTTIRSHLISIGRGTSQGVPYKERREFISGLRLVRREVGPSIEEDIKIKLRQIHVRDASYEELAINEKLRAIMDLIENILKIKGKFKISRIDEYSHGFITNDDIKSYRNKLQCFRHATHESIEDRNTFSEKEKYLFIDFGITIVNALAREFDIDSST